MIILLNAFIYEIINHYVEYFPILCLRKFNYDGIYCYFLFYLPKIKGVNLYPTKNNFFLISFSASILTLI